MQKYLKIQQLCLQHQEPLDLLCLNEQCDHRGIICSHCQYQHHKHPVKSLTSIIEQIIADGETGQKNLGAFAQIDQIYQQSLVRIPKIKNAGQAKILQETIVFYYRDLCEKITRKQLEAKKISNNQLGTLSELNEFILKYQFISKEENPKNLSNFEYYLEKKLEEFRANLKQFSQAIANEDSFDKMISIFTIEDQKKIKYWFNCEKMHKQIIQVDLNKVKIKDGYSYRMALLDPPIRKEMRKTNKKSCNFKIGMVGAMVGVGICYKKKVEDLNYVFSAYSAHGCYLIASNGYTYNQFDKNYNSQIKNWTFTGEEIIKVTILPEQKKIQFKKEGEELFEFQYEEKPEYEMNFAAMMCSANETVQVLHL